LLVVAVVVVVVTILIFQLCFRFKKKS
jgi:hypothetical protein